LPPAPVSVEWNKDQPVCIEQLLAALWRDGSVILSHAVLAELCDQVLDRGHAALHGSGEGEEILARVLCTETGVRRQRKNHDSNAAGSITTRVGCLPARSQSSHPIIAHPALLQVCEAVIGRQARQLVSSCAGPRLTRFWQG
jgi:hypothetical protein